MSSCGGCPVTPPATLWCRWHVHQPTPSVCWSVRCTATRHLTKHADSLLVSSLQRHFSMASRPKANQPRLITYSMIWFKGHFSSWAILDLLHHYRPVWDRQTNHFGPGHFRIDRSPSYTHTSFTDRHWQGLTLWRLTVSSGCSLIRNLRRLKHSLRIFAQENELIFFMLPWHTKMPEWATARSIGTPSWSYSNMQNHMNHYQCFTTGQCKVCFT